jgi:hypothetical protein
MGNPIVDPQVWSPAGCGGLTWTRDPGPRAGAHAVTLAPAR